MNKLDAFLAYGREKGYWNSGKGALFYFQRELFPDIAFAGNRFLDIGAGRGVFCGFANALGAAGVVGLEPAAAGSGDRIVEDFQEMVSRLELENIELLPHTIQDYDPGTQRFDLVFMHATINHLDEDRCMRLHEDESARQIYRELLGRIRSWMAPGGRMVVHDVSRGNFSTRFGLRRGSRYNHTIEWEKHQNADTWIQLIQSSGFRLVKRGYKGQPRYRQLSYLFKNRLMAWLRWNEFILIFEPDD